MNQLLTLPAAVGTHRSKPIDLPRFEKAAKFTVPEARFELKYKLNEVMADRIRDYARNFLTLDRHADPETLSYPINSLYLDSEELTTFWATVNGAHHRYKLRVRTYDDRLDGPVFFETKRAVGEMTVKERGAVKRHAVEKILRGWLPEPSDMINNDAGHFYAVENFVRLMQQINAKPKAYVRYEREPWVGREDPTLRLTFDRAVGVAPQATGELPNAYGEKSQRPFGGQVILEMKYSGPKPAWFRDLEIFAGLQETAAAKYCGGIMMHDQDEFSPVDWPVADLSRFIAEPAAFEAAAARRTGAGVSIGQARCAA